MQKYWTRILFLCVFLFSFLCSKSQEKLISDVAFINEITAKQKSKTKHRSFIYSSEDQLTKKINPLNMAFGGLLYIYQNTLSQQFSATCLYHPSCSDFSKQCIHEYGILKGVFLSADRVSRCNRIAATGIHPLRVENNKVQDPVSFYISIK